ncbi:Thymidylate kinase [Rickettsiales endosymbiont of Paramecium tredecaurelia]|uniref:dTMP kinase n=1 Tax=Candidatus Sarmatiella mevalonica TaxID=2770581 RepID=UPI0019213BBE|nr:thymidylate kinase [Candidatus Sarmatiella mevalonica]MBL3284654.1 Thymidylate kinase [Candidatus Sarmatiella mevalonica]
MSILPSNSHIQSSDLHTPRQTTSGLFISFEGGDCVGKSTQVDLLAEYFSSQSIEYVKTREVGHYDEVGEKIRDLMLHGSLSSWSQFHLIMVARYEHLLRKIIPALLAGKIVICDRFVDSTAVYQGYCNESKRSTDWVYCAHDKMLRDMFLHIISSNKSLSKLTHEEVSCDVAIDPILFQNYYLQSKFLPDITFILDAQDDIVSNRLAQKNNPDRFERNKEMQRLVRRGFLTLATQRNLEERRERLHVIDSGGLTSAQVHEVIIKKIKLYIKF